MGAPLAGIRVVDMARGWAGPGTAMYLGDQGAEVLKVEPPWGDDARHYYTASPIAGEDRGFLVVNRNKRGMAVDMATPAGKEIVLRLLKTTDVLVENFRPEAAEKLGLSYEQLHPQFPRLICAHLSGFGPRGPYAGLPGYDLVTQALAGLMGRRWPDGTPMNAGVWVADCSTPMVLAYGITLALLVRERTGQGQRVETALVNQAIAMQSVELVQVTREGGKPAERYSAQALYNPYRCADDRWLTVIISNNPEWERLCRALGIDELALDPEFDHPLKRARQSQVLYPILANLFATRPREEWLKVLHAAELPCAPVLTREEVFTHPQLVENEMVVTMHHPLAGEVRMMGVPVRLSGNPPIGPHPAPRIGEHTREVLLELGYSPGEIGEFQRQGVIPTPP